MNAHLRSIRDIRTTLQFLDLDFMKMSNVFSAGMGVLSFYALLCMGLKNFLSR